MTSKDAVRLNLNTLDLEGSQSTGLQLRELLTERLVEALGGRFGTQDRSEERRVGKEC